jgi:hypothetical protein
MGVYRVQWGAYVLMCVASVNVLACDPTRDRDAGLRGPPDGVLMFDPSMLVDASTNPDVGTFRPSDAGRPDAFQRDAGRRQRCSGVAYSCATRSTACSDIMGCFDDSECRGVASGCYYRSSSYACTSQSGCYWSSTSRRCSGSARSCGSFAGPASCSGQDGCYWSDQCGGTAFSCATLSNATCESQPGCSLVWE